MRNYLLSALLSALILPAALHGQQWKEKKHSLSITSGAAPWTYDWEVMDGIFGRSCDAWDMHDNYYDNERTYTGPMLTSGSVSVTYNYRVLKHLSLDASATYTGFYSKSYYVRDNRQAANRARHYTYFQIGFSGVWLNRPMVEMYSGIEVGLGGIFTKDPYYHENKFFPGTHFKIIGLKVGRSRWYGTAELGFGTKGLASAGFGYRF